VRVGLEGDGYGSVPEHLGHYLWVDVLDEQQRGACVPEVVEAYLWQSRPLEQRLESVRRDVVTVLGALLIRRRNEAVLAPQIARLVYFSPHWRSRWLLKSSRAVGESFTVRGMRAVLGQWRVVVYLYPKQKVHPR
jgi:hypothetical protein